MNPALKRNGVGLGEDQNYFVAALASLANSQVQVHLFTLIQLQYNNNKEQKRRKKKKQS